ncbi:MAG TPA: hypothetical protein VIK34_00140 [Clostridiaceae bacterium]
MKKLVNYNKCQMNPHLKLKIISVLVVFLFTIILYGCSSNGTSGTQLNNTFPKKIYKAGEEGVSGNWSMKVLEANETNTIQSGDISYQVTTNEKFIVITLQIKNITNYPIKYTSREFLLRNINNESQYNINNVAFNAMTAANGSEKIYKENSNFVGVYDEVGPSTTKRTFIIFEVPKDTSAADYMLVNTNDNGEPTGYNLK